MGLFEHFPYTNFHELNLDWLLKIVREWVDKTEIYFKNNDEAIKFLQSNFDDLKDYVDSYFDSLDVKKEVSDKLDEMLESGELADILAAKIVTWDMPRMQRLNGRPCVRERKDYYLIPSDNTAPYWSMQNGTVYNSSGDYSFEASGRFLYYYEVLSDDSICDLVTYDISNQRITNRQTVNHGKHGGGLYVKDGKLYSICTRDNYLYIWDLLSDPAQPSLETERQLNITANNLIGYYENGGFWMAAKNYENNGREIYRISDDFTVETYLYTVDTSDGMISQDWHLDNVNNVMYQAQTWGANVITVINVINGEVLTDFEIPEHIAYAITGEIEYIFAHGKYIYFGGIAQSGVAQSIKICYNSFYIDINKLNETRHIQPTQAAPRTIRISQDYDPLNPPVGTIAGSNLYFRWFDDAMMYAIDSGTAPVIAFDSDYDETFRVIANCRINLNNHNMRAIVVDNDVVATFTGLRGEFTGAPVKYTQSDISAEVECFIFCGVGSRVTFTRIDQIPVNTDADVMIWGNYCEINIPGRRQIKSLLTTFAIVHSQGYIGEDVYSYSSLYVIGGVWINSGDSQYIDDSTVIKATGITSEANPRLPLNSIYNKLLCKPAIYSTTPGANSQNRPIGELFIYGLSNQTVRYGYYSDPTTWIVVEAALEYITLTSPVAGFTARRWRITGTPPDAIANYQGLLTFN